MWHVYALPAFADNYLWLLASDAGNRAAIVDPGDAVPVMAALKERNLELSAILITHHHADHIGGVEKLMTHYPEVQVYGPEDSRIPRVQYVMREQSS